MMSLPFLNHMPTLAGIFILGSFGLMVMLLGYLSNRNR